MAVQLRLPGLDARMRLGSLGSGSRGNGTLVEVDGVRLLIDCGFTVRETLARLARLQLAPEDLTAILVTHEHADHAQGAAPFARQFGTPVYLSHGTLRAMGDWDGVDLRPFDSRREFFIQHVAITPVPVPHDACEPTQFVVHADGCCIGVLTDVGSVTRWVRERYARCDVLLIESNHDRDLLWRGSYPWPLKRRIASGYGHLCNEQAVELVTAVAHGGLRHVVIGHISEQNNSREHLERAFAPLVARLPCLSFASQSGEADWIECISPAPLRY